MDITYVHSESTAAPASAVDTTSSPTSVHLYRNIQKVQRQDLETGVTYDMYEFEVATLSKQEYALYQAEQAAAADNTDAQLAIAELAEMVVQNQQDLELAIAELAEAVVQ